MEQIAPSPTRPTPDRTTRQAALWATVVAIPLALLVGFLTVQQFRPDEPAAAPSPSTSATAARPVPTSPVTVAAPPLSERSATVCRALISALPATLRDLAQRPVTAGAEQNAAYGDPALTISCGVPAPAVPATDDVWGVNRVCWHPVEGPDAVVLTSVDREVPIAVTVPKTYGQPLQWVAPISETAVASVPATRAAVPSGCTG